MLQVLYQNILTRKNAHIELLNKFQKGEIDILVGTQMIAKGLDNPNVTLVGVLSADSGFNIPDYRASERGFQLLTQVAGRAGRGEFKGKVLFQTYNPDYYAFQTAKSQNYEKFFDHESLCFPPYAHEVWHRGGSLEVGPLLHRRRLQKFPGGYFRRTKPWSFEGLTRISFLPPFISFQRSPSQFAPTLIARTKPCQPLKRPWKVGRN